MVTNRRVVYCVQKGWVLAVNPQGEARGELTVDFMRLHETTDQHVREIVIDKPATLLRQKERSANCVANCGEGGQTSPNDDHFETMKHPFYASCFALFSIALCQPLFAQLPSLGESEEDDLLMREQTRNPEPNPSARFEWMVGGAVLNTPTYSGASDRVWKLRPLWSVRYGRFTVTGPRANIGRTFADESASSAGVNAALFQTDRFRASIGFRVDGGRKSGVDPILRGLPDVERRALYSLNLGYKLTEQWSASASFASDLRSAETGSTFRLGVGHTKRLGERWIWANGAAITYADHHYMEKFHGVAVPPPGSTLTKFDPSAGLRDVGLSSTVRYQLDRNWVAFGSASVGRLVGDAAKSPLTTTKNQSTLMLGVAYNGSSWPFSR